MVVISSSPEVSIHKGNDAVIVCMHAYIMSQPSQNLHNCNIELPKDLNSLAPPPSDLYIVGVLLLLTTCNVCIINCVKSLAGPRGLKSLHSAHGSMKHATVVEET